MKTNKAKKVNIIDLIFLIAVVAVVLLLVVSNVLNINKSNTDKDVATFVKYIIEVQNREPQILDYMEEGQTVYEHGSMNPIGTVKSISKRAATALVEDHANKNLAVKELSDKISFNIEAESKGEIVDDIVEIAGVKLLIGKSIDCVVGDAVMSGIIVGIEYEEAEENKEVQK